MSQKSRSTYKEKSWYEVYAPDSFDNTKIGEIIGVEGTLMDRTIETLLYNFTDDYDDINCKLIFKVIDVNTEAKTCKTTLTGHKYTTDFTRRMVGKGASKVTSIKNFTTKDEYIYRLTTVCVTIRRARSSQKKVIRKIMREVLKKFSKTLEHEKFVTGMIFGEFENQIQRIAKTIFPLFNCKIIKSKLISMPEGGKDEKVEDEEFDIVELDIERTRKSEIRRTERINVNKYAEQKKRRKRKEEKEKEEADEGEEQEETSGEEEESE
jgi:small subunit ribosomal protein S3Ae